MKNKISPTSFDKYMRENQEDPLYRAAYHALDNDPDVVLIEALAAAHKKGLTQKEIAVRMNTTQSTISRAFSSNGNPTLEFLTRFAKAIDMKLEIKFV